MSDTTRRSLDSGGHPGWGSSAENGQAGLLLLYPDDVPGLSNVHLLRGVRLKVGREPESEVRIDHETVSRAHAELVHTEDGWTVHDLGSRNGTLLDGSRVRSAVLVPGSIIRFGDLFYKFVAAEAELHAAYLPNGRMRGAAVRLAPKDSTLVGGLQIDRISAKLAKVARSDLALLLLGESGTGKEVAAEQIHRASRRRGRLCATNCAAIPATLLESELFGFRKGAFSGADRDKPGLFQAADGGTLLLDEIGDMPAESQAKLLRVLQSGCFTPLGAVEPIQVDVRIIAATHQDLAERQKDGRFRGDLFARLSEFMVHLPPLRARKEDILVLCRTFLRKHDAPTLELSIGFVAALLHYDWPNNVRELESCVRRCITVTDGPLLKRQLLPEAVLEATARYGEPGEGDSIPRIPRTSRPSATPSVNEVRLRTLLKLHHGNISAVARELGKARMQVHRWLDHCAIDPEDYRQDRQEDE